MSNINRGKQFEEQVRRGFEVLSNCSIDRIPDQMNGYAGSSNICDFIVYRRPIILYLECKSCYGTTLNFHNITDKQWRGLLFKSKITGVVAGVMIWFIDYDVTLFVPIEVLQNMKNSGLKSVNVRHITQDMIPISGKKKRVFFEYNMKPFLDEVTYGRHSK